jgi:transposase
VLRGRDVQDFGELKRQGLSIRAISRVTGYCRKTVRKYLIQPDAVPVYGPRAKQPGKLDPFKPYLEDRMRAGVCNAHVLLREIREHGYSGGYTLLTDWLRPQRESAHTVAVRRFETPPGKQAQVDWGHLGTLEVNGEKRKLWGFTCTLGLQPHHDGRGGTRLETRDTVADARGGLPPVGWRAGGDSLRPHEDGLAGDGRTR